MKQTYFKLNQTVFSAKYGEGKVVGIKKNFEYPICVHFGHDEREARYTYDGKLYTHHPVTLSQNPIVEIMNTPLTPIEVGDWVVITKSDNNWTKSMEEYLNRVVQVSSIIIDNNNNLMIKSPNLSPYFGWTFEEGHFRLATQEEIPCCK